MTSSYDSVAILAQATLVQASKVFANSERRPDFMSDSEPNACAFDFVDAPPVAPKPKRARRCAALPARFESAALLCVWLIVDPYLRAPSVLQEMMTNSIDDEPILGSGLCVIGVAFITFSLVSSKLPVAGDARVSLQEAARRAHRRANIIGFAEYNVKDLMPLSEPHELTRQDADEFFLTCHQLRALHDKFVGGVSLPDRCTSHDTRLPTQAIRLPMTIAALLLRGQMSVASVHAICQKMHKSSLLEGFPTAGLVRRWRTAHNQDDDDDIANDPGAFPDYQAGSRQSNLPGVRALDPVVIFKAVKFGVHLRNVRSSPDALVDAIDCVTEDAAVASALAVPSEQPKPTAVYDARQRVDAVSMLLERREMAELYAERETVESMHLYTDASPVTGTELQGQILEICLITKIIMTLILPGVALHYGHAGIAYKALALLWALYLIVGPCLEILSWVLTSIRSTTTDMGSELGLLCTPNLLPQFLRYLCGATIFELKHTVEPYSRLMPRALRLPGWGHLHGRFTYLACNKFPKWPEYLKYMRQLCAFFRNADWRANMVA